jgi:hypothetical protein
MSADPTNIREGERMFAYRWGHFKGLLTLVCALGAIVVAGCGGSGGGEPSTAGGSTSGSTSADTADADPGDLEVIEDWSNTLSEGDVKGAAGYFALPSTAQNGTVLVHMLNLGDAIAFNDSLPCGAEVTSARSEGAFTTATFRLTERPGGDCGSGVGGKASTSFQIEDGKIVEWRRIDAPPSRPSSDSEGSAPV